MPTWSIGFTDRERIEVEVLSPHENDCGHDWVRARVRLDLGGFRGEFEMTPLASDMRRFRDALGPVYRDLRGAAEFETMEDQLYLKVEVDKLEHVTMRGHATDAAGRGNRLAFEVVFDQTLLRRTLSELDDALAQLRA